MSIIINKFHIALLLLFSCVSISNGTSGKKFYHPLLGISYNPEIIKYKKLPTKAVKEVYNDRFKDPERHSFFIFASYDNSKDDGNIYYIVAGSLPSIPDLPITKEDGVVNVDSIIVKNKGSYRAIGSAIEFDVRGFPKNVVDGLAANAADIAIRAYGDVEALQKQLDIHWNKNAKLGKEVVKALQKRGIYNLSIQDFNAY